MKLPCGRCGDCMQCEFEAARRFGSRAAEGVLMAWREERPLTAEQQRWAIVARLIDAARASQWSRNAGYALSHLLAKYPRTEAA